MGCRVWELLRGFCGRASALRRAVGSSGCVGGLCWGFWGDFHTSEAGLFTRDPKALGSYRTRQKWTASRATTHTGGASNSVQAVSSNGARAVSSATAH